MAIAFDAASNGQNTSSNSLTVSHTCSGSNRLLLVGVASQTGGGYATVNGVTYNGVSMTLVDEKLTSANRNLSLWKLVAPATGANNIVVSLNATNDETQLAAVSYTGVDQGTPLGTSATANDSTDTSNGPITVDVSSATGEVVVDFAGPYFALTASTVGAGQTKRSENDSTATTGSWVGMSEEAGAASVTMSWTVNNTPRSWSTIAVPIKPSTASSPALAGSAITSNSGTAGPGISVGL